MTTATQAVAFCGVTKLNVRGRAQLVVLAYQSGLVRPGGQLP